MYKNITIEIWETFKNRFLFILGTILLPLLIMVAISSSVNYFIGSSLTLEINTSISNIVLLLSVIISVVIGMTILMMIYKGALEDSNTSEGSIAFLKMFSTGHLKGFMFNAVLLSIGFVLISVITIFSFSFILAFATGNASMGGLGMMLGLFLTLLFYTRIVIVLPASSIGDKLTFTGAMSLTKEYKALSFYSILLLPFLFAINLAIVSMIIITIVSFFTQGIFIFFFSIIINLLNGLVIAIFVNICIAILYKYLKENSKGNSSKNIEGNTTKDIINSKED